MRSVSRSRLPAWLLLEGLLVVLLVACSGFSSAGRASGPVGAGADGVAGASGEPGQPGQPGEPGQPGGTSSSSGISMVTCSGTLCSVTLAGSGSSVHVLGTTISFDGIDDGRATLLVAGGSTSCAQGETVAAGPLTIRCTSVTDDAVTFDASPG